METRFGQGLNLAAVAQTARETLGVVGETGSGKSALVRTIMGLQQRSAVVPPESQLVFEDTDIRSLPTEKKRHLWGPKIAMIFQDPMTSLNLVRTIGWQLIAPMRYHLGALSCDPELLIADEPTTALDVTMQKQILDLLDQLQHGRHMPVILISHDLGAASSLPTSKAPSDSAPAAISSSGAWPRNGPH
jgi:peptide/nickel transport system ATP-binding protein